MAAMVPGGCSEVDPAMCGSAPAGTSTTVTGAGGDGPTEISVLAKEPTELKPYAGGADVVIQIYNIRDFSPTTGAPRLTEVARGRTDAAGVYGWTGQAPAPNKDYRYRVSVSLPGGPVKSFDVLARSAAALAAGNRMVTRHQVTLAVCPGNVDPLVCAVADAQLDWQSIYQGQLAAWSGGDNAASFAADMAHANVRLDHPKLQAHRETFSWWVGDAGIPPKDWPALVTEFERMSAIFNAIPFPRWPGIEDLFQRCARGVPIGQGKNAERYNVSSPRLYSKTWSDYFPRSDEQIKKDMAAAYIIGLQPILLCMQRRIQKKIEETQRTTRTMAVISYATVMINLPFLIASGVGGFAAFATETYDLIVMTQQGKEPLGVGVTAGIAAASLLTGDPAIVAGALEPVVNSLIGDMDPIAATAVRSIYPQVVKFAVESVGSIASNSAQAGSNTIVNGASSFIDTSAIATAISVMAVKAIAALPKLYAVERIKELQDDLAGAQMAAQDVLGFVSGEEVSPTFRPFLIWVVEALGLVELVNQAIDDFLDQFQQAIENGQQQGGGVAVVPEAGGGGPAVTPTDSQGTPTDAQGTPLPGGEAPLTPPSGGSTIPGVPPPTMPPMPTTTIAQGPDTLTAAAGLGGSALALLLVSGAIS